MIITEKSLSGLIKEKSIDRIKTIFLNNYNLENILFQSIFTVNLEFLSLQNNYLKDLNFVKLLRNLWYLDLRNNPIENFSGLGIKNQFGFLGLSISKISEKAILEIKNLDVGILYFNCEEKFVQKSFLKNNKNIFRLNNDFNKNFDEENGGDIKEDIENLNIEWDNFNKEKFGLLKIFFDKINFLKRKIYNLLNVEKNKGKFYEYISNHDYFKFTNKNIKKLLLEFQKLNLIFFVKLKESFLDLNKNSGEIFDYNYKNFLSTPLTNLFYNKSIEERRYYFNLQILRMKNIYIQLIFIMIIPLEILSVFEKNFCINLILFFIKNKTLNKTDDELFFRKIENDLTYLFNLDTYLKFGIYFDLINYIKKNFSNFHKKNHKNSKSELYTYLNKNKIQDLINILENISLLEKFKLIVERNYYLKNLNIQNLVHENRHLTEIKTMRKENIFSYLMDDCSLFEEIFILIETLKKLIFIYNYKEYSDKNRELEKEFQFFLSIEKSIFEKFYINISQNNGASNLKYKKIVNELIFLTLNENKEYSTDDFNDFKLVEFFQTQEKHFNDVEKTPISKQKSKNLCMNSEKKNKSFNSISSKNLNNSGNFNVEQSTSTSSNFSKKVFLSNFNKNNLKFNRSKNLLEKTNNTCYNKNFLNDKLSEIITPIKNKDEKFVEKYNNSLSRNQKINQLNEPDLIHQMNDLKLSDNIAKNFNFSSTYFNHKGPQNEKFRRMTTNFKKVNNMNEMYFLSPKKVELSFENEGKISASTNNNTNSYLDSVDKNLLKFKIFKHKNSIDMEECSDNSIIKKSNPLKVNHFSIIRCNKKESPRPNSKEGDNCFISSNNNNFNLDNHIAFPNIISEESKNQKKMLFTSVNNKKFFQSTYSIDKHFRKNKRKSSKNSELLKTEKNLNENKLKIFQNTGNLRKSNTLINNDEQTSEKITIQSRLISGLFNRLKNEDQITNNSNLENIYIKTNPKILNQSELYASITSKKNSKTVEKKKHTKKNSFFKMDCNKNRNENFINTAEKFNSLMLQLKNTEKILSDQPNKNRNSQIDLDDILYIKESLPSNGNNQDLNYDAISQNTNMNNTNSNVSIRENTNKTKFMIGNKESKKIVKKESINFRSNIKRLVHHWNKNNPRWGVVENNYIKENDFDKLKKKNKTFPRKLINYQEMSNLLSIQNKDQEILHTLIKK